MEVNRGDCEVFDQITQVHSSQESLFSHYKDKETCGKIPAVDQVYYILHVANIGLINRLYK